MADLKISQLPSATAPLAGTEVLPIVQSSATNKVSVANLTVGRSVSAAALATTAGNVDVVNAAAKVTLTSSTTTNAAWLQLTNGGGTTYMAIETAAGGGFGGDPYDLIYQLPIGRKVTTYINGTGAITNISATGLQMVTGNVTMSTAAKGVNFTANTPAAGMTSQLLNWYEEGTWTPTVTAGTGSLTAYTSSGIYTRIGRQVFIQGIVTLTNVGTAGGTALINGFPFTIAATYNPSGTCREMANTGEIFNVNGQQGSTYGYLASLTNGAITWTNNYKYSFNMVYTV